MKKRIFMGILSTLLIILTGCNNLGVTNSTSSPMSQERIASSVDINEEIFGIGSAVIGESGNGVAKMRASKAAREDIRKKLMKETEIVLKAYLVDIDFYSKNISDDVMSDLSEYITNNLLNDVEEKDSWIENNKVYTVIAIDRDQIPTRSRDTFVAHIDSIIKKLSEIRTKILEIPIDQVSPTAPSVEVKADTAPAAAPVVSEKAPTEESAPVEKAAPAADTSTVEEVQFTDDEVIDVQL